MSLEEEIRLMVEELLQKGSGMDEAVKDVRAALIAEVEKGRAELSRIPWAVEKLAIFNALYGGVR